MGVWIEEREVFASAWERLSAALEASGHELVAWQDHWFVDGAWRGPAFADRGACFFHTSLGVAAELADTDLPGVYCDADAFRCGNWYDDFADGLVHQRTWAKSTVRALCAMSLEELEELIGPGERCFVRPDSPLKPFSGRVLERDALTPAALDHGFYYEDDQLDVIVASCREVGEEWRFVVVNGELVTAGAYDAQTRTAAPNEESVEATVFAYDLVQRHDLSRFGGAVALDVARVDGVWRIMEFNPLSGASLYGCDFEAIAKALL